MKGAKQILVIAAAAVAGAGVSAAVVEHSFAPGRDTVRTVIRPVNVTSGANASALKTAGKSVNEIFTARRRPSSRSSRDPGLEPGQRVRDALVRRPGPGHRL